MGKDVKAYDVDGKVIDVPKNHIIIQGLIMNKLILILLTTTTLSAWNSPLPDPHGWSGHDTPKDAAEILKIPVLINKTATIVTTPINTSVASITVVEPSHPTRDELGEIILRYTRLSAQLQKHRKQSAAIEQQLVTEMAKLYKIIEKESAR
jgi:hypothetical protein